MPVNVPKKDARGLSCPEPVLLVKKRLELEDAIETFSVIVDSVAARDNVTRFLRARGFTVSASLAGDAYELSACRGGSR